MQCLNKFKDWKMIMNSGQEEGANRSMYENIIRAFDWKR